MVAVAVAVVVGVAVAVVVVVVVGVAVGVEVAGAIAVVVAVAVAVAVAVVVGVAVAGGVAVSAHAEAVRAVVDKATDLVWWDQQAEDGVAGAAAHRDALMGELDDTLTTLAATPAPGVEELRASMLAALDDDEEDTYDIVGKCARAAILDGEGK